MEPNQIAATLRLALDQEAARHEISRDAWPQIERRLRWQTWRRAGMVAACVAMAVAAAATAPYLWRVISGPAASHTHQQPAPQLVIVDRTHLRPGVTDVAAGYGAVWVVGSGVIYRVDPVTAKPVATIATPAVGDWSHITAGLGAVWVTTGIQPHAGVYRIDPRHNRVTSFIPLPPDPIDIAVAYGRVWVAEPRQGPGIVLRLDPRSNRVIGRPIRVGTGPGPIVAGFGAVWVNNWNGEGSVSRIDPASGAVTRTLVNTPEIDAVGDGSLWGTTWYGAVQRIDPATGRVTAAIRLPNAQAVTFWAGSAWVSVEPPGTIARIDPASNRVVSKAVPAGTSPASAASPNGLWVIDFTKGDILHFIIRSRS
jgi:DNA-binding beta-propeller fold protein YncE